MQGFGPAIVARELLLRTSPLAPGKWLFTLICSASSASARATNSPNGGRQSPAATRPGRSSARRATSGTRSGTCSWRCRAPWRRDLLAQSTSRRAAGDRRRSSSSSDSDDGMPVTQPWRVNGGRRLDALVGRRSFVAAGLSLAGCAEAGAPAARADLSARPGAASTSHRSSSFLELSARACATAARDAQIWPGTNPQPADERLSRRSSSTSMPRALEPVTGERRGRARSSAGGSASDFYGKVDASC